MYQNTPAIVLHMTKHTDKTAIVHLFTRDFGRITCAVHGVYTKKGAPKAALLEPLSLVEVELLEKPGFSLLQLREVRLLYQQVELPFSMEKRCIALFLAEVFFRTLTYSHKEEVLFAFLYESIIMLDRCDSSANFHIHCLIQLTQHLGCFPNLEEEGDFFDLLSGERTSVRPLHAHYVQGNTCQLLKTFTECATYDKIVVALSRKERQQLLDALITYYKLHIPDFHGVQSLAVLTELYS